MQLKLAEELEVLVETRIGSTLFNTNLLRPDKVSNSEVDDYRLDYGTAHMP
jgi:hypothetical protein